MNKKTFYVTNDDLQNGSRDSDIDCPIARSLKRGGLINPKVGIRFITHGPKFARVKLPMDRDGMRDRPCVANSGDDLSGVGLFKDAWQACLIDRDIKDLKSKNMVKAGMLFRESNPATNAPVRFVIDLDEGYKSGHSIEGQAKRKAQRAINELSTRKPYRYYSRGRKDGLLFDRSDVIPLTN